MHFTSKLDLKSSLPPRSTQTARAKKIRQLGRNNGVFRRTLLNVYYCYEMAGGWDDLSPPERIMLEAQWTNLLLELQGLGNSRVMHSIRYRLREQAPQEDELDKGESY